MTDIEKALAEGMDSLGPTLPDNAYIAEHLADTPPMQEVARLAVIGAAVEGLPLDHALLRYMADDGEPWWAVEGLGDGPTIEAAIAAATGEDEQ